jgi:hypothetical protein
MKWLCPCGELLHELLSVQQSVFACLIWPFVVNNKSCSSPRKFSGNHWSTFTFGKQLRLEKGKKYVAFQCKYATTCFFIFLKILIFYFKLIFLLF